MLHLDPSVRGRHVKIGSQWVKLDAISKADVETGAGGRKKIRIVRNDGKPDVVYEGSMPDLVRGVLRREGKGGKD